MKTAIPLLYPFRWVFFLALSVLVLALGTFLLIQVPAAGEVQVDQEERIFDSRNVKEMLRNRARSAVRLTEFARKNIRSRVQAELDREVDRIANSFEQGEASGEGRFAFPSVASWMEGHGTASGALPEEIQEYMFLCDPTDDVVALYGPLYENFRGFGPLPPAQHPVSPTNRKDLKKEVSRIASHPEGSSSLTSLQRIGDSDWRVGELVPGEALKQAVRERILHLLQEESSGALPSLFLIDGQSEVHSFSDHGGNRESGPGGRETVERIEKTLQAVNDGGYVSSSKEQNTQQRQFTELFLEPYQPWEWLFVAAAPPVPESVSTQKGYLVGEGFPSSIWLTVFAALLFSVTLLFLAYRFLFARVAGGLSALKNDLETAAKDPEHSVGETQYPFTELSSLAATANQVLERSKERESRAESEKSYFEELFQNAPDGIVLADSNGYVLRVNKEFCTHFLFKEDEVQGRELDSLVGGEDKITEAGEFTDKVSRGYRIYTETVRYRKDGQAVPVAVYGVPLTTQTGERLIYGLYKDIREKKEAEEKLLQLTETDALTGVANRLKLEQLLEEELKISQRYASSFSLIMMDIDFFKEINDQYGHLVGDEVLKELAATMENSIRDADVLARVGGEEFLILLRRTDYDDAVCLAERIRSEIEANEFSVDRSITCSFGVTVYREDDDSKTLLNRVDDFLYIAKKNGRNRVVGGVKQGVVLGY